MTFRLSMIAAVLLLSSTTAFASDVSTDAARARAAEASHVGRVAPFTTAVGVPSTTDQARALTAAAASTSASRPVLAASGAPTSTDQARAHAAGGVPAELRSSEHTSASACAQSCACHHG